jgi:FixJ family two-component response regulator
MYAITHEAIQPAGEELTMRQRQIFDLIVVGFSNKEIARMLGLRNRSPVALAGAKVGVRRPQTCHM